MCLTVCLSVCLLVWEGGEILRRRNVCTVGRQSLQKCTAAFCSNAALSDGEAAKWKERHVDLFVLKHTVFKRTQQEQEQTKERKNLTKTKKMTIASILFDRYRFAWLHWRFILFSIDHFSDKIGSFFSRIHVLGPILSMSLHWGNNSHHLVLKYSGILCFHGT